MKKTLITIALTVLGAMTLAAPAMAVTTVSLSPAGTNVTLGKTFNVVISVNPQGVASYTQKIELTYPADLLEIRAFNFGGNWMALSQTGYDLIDNTKGILVKSAGYPGGLSSPATFGAISFYAKKSGSGTIKLGNGSLSLDANNQNVLSGSPSISVAVTAPAVVPATPGTPITPSPAETPIVPAEQPATEQPITATQTSFAATIGGFLTLGTDNVLLGILVGLLILAGIIYAVYLLIKRKNPGGM